MRVITPVAPRELVGNVWVRRAQGWCCSTARSWGFGGRYGNKLGGKIYFPFVCSHLLLRLHCLVLEQREPGRAGPQRCCLLWEQKWHSQGENVAVKGDALGSWLCPGRVFLLITAPN